MIELTEKDVAEAWRYHKASPIGKVDIEIERLQRRGAESLARKLSPS
jgi:hypothetical protein